MNKFNEILTDMIVVLDKEKFVGTERERQFVCKGGCGCLPGCKSRKIIGHRRTDPDEMLFWISDEDIEFIWCKLPPESQPIEVDFKTKAGGEGEIK